MTEYTIQLVVQIADCWIEDGCDLNDQTQLDDKITGPLEEGLLPWATAGVEVKVSAKTISSRQIEEAAA